MADRTEVRVPVLEAVRLATMVRDLIGDCIPEDAEVAVEARSILDLHARAATNTDAIVRLLEARNLDPEDVEDAVQNCRRVLGVPPGRSSTVQSEITLLRDIRDQFLEETKDWADALCGSRPTLDTLRDLAQKSKGGA